jgi:hypothetical protein
VTTDVIEMEASEIDENILAPELRALGETTGVPILIDGSTWLLAHGGCASILDVYRDRLDDHARLKDQVALADIFEAARVMLQANYDITVLEAVHLMASTDPKALTEAVMTAMFGGGSVHKTYSMWMMSSLYGAGLNPEIIPAEWIPAVLDQLVMTGRAVPISKFTDAAQAAPKLRAARARAEAYAAKKAAEAEAIPAPIEAPTEATP